MNPIINPVFLNAACNRPSDQSVRNYSNMSLEQLMALTYNEKRTAVSRLGLEHANNEQATLDAVLQQYVETRDAE